jgi:hypothetical protein
MKSLALNARKNPRQQEEGNQKADFKEMGVIECPSSKGF